MCGHWWHICYLSLLAILRKKVGEPKEESRNLYRFAYVNSYNLWIHIFFEFINVNSYNLWIHIIQIIFSSIVHKGYFHGHDTLPLHGETRSAIDEQTETGPRKTPPTTHSNVRWRKRIRGKKWKPSIQFMQRIVFTGVCGMVNNTTEPCECWCL
jgi:hypothetical protein